MANSEENKNKYKQLRRKRQSQQRSREQMTCSVRIIEKSLKRLVECC